VNLNKHPLSTNSNNSSRENHTLNEVYDYNSIDSQRLFGHPMRLQTQLLNTSIPLSQFNVRMQ